MNELFHQPHPMTPCSVVIGIGLSSSETHSEFISKMALDEFILSFMFLQLNYCPLSVAYTTTTTNNFREIHYCTEFMNLLTSSIFDFFQT